MLGELDRASTYFMNRLALARQASVPASVQFDLARSPMSDDELEATVDGFRETPREKDGWGIAPIFQELLTREPEKVKVNDLTALQESLIDKGYLSPDYRPTGVWDATSNAALRRLDNDARQEQFRGHHLGAAPIEAGIRLITNTLPSRVWQGIIGTAKGLAAQTGETFERGGLLGGAAAGAGIGAAAGSVLPGPGTLVGAGIGAAVGGVSGFLADLFGEEEEGEQDPSQYGTLIDALTPFEEYATKPKAFFEDLGYVASAASLIAGGGMAVKGAAGALGVARATSAAVPAGIVPSSLPSMFGGAAGAATQAAKPAGSFLGSLMSTTGAAETGWFAKIAAAASRPVLGANRVERMVELVKVHGLNAQMSRPAFQAVNKAYSGLARGSIGARMAAGAMSGEGAPTTIEQGIASVDPLPDYVDMLGIMLYPEGLLPFKAKQVSNVAMKVMGNTDLLPLAHIIQTEKNIPLRQAVVEAREALGENPMQQAITNTWLRYQFGLDMKAAEKVVKLKHDAPGPAADGTFYRARFDTVAKLKKKEEGLAAELIGYSVDSPAAFEAWLRDKSVGKLPNYLKADKALQRMRRDIRAGRINIDSQVRGFVADAEANFRFTEIKRAADAITKQAGDLRKQAGRSTDPVQVAAWEQEIVQLEASAKKMMQSAPSTRGEARTAENMVITAERLDTPTTQDLKKLGETFEHHRQKVIAAVKAKNLPAAADARMGLTDFVDDLAYKGIIPRPLAEGALKADKPSGKIAEHLKMKARYAASDIQLPDAEMAELAALGYKPVATSGEVIMPSDVERLGEVMGAGDYTRRASFFETLGLSPRWRGDDGLADLRKANEIAEIEKVLEGSGIKWTGKELQNKLFTRLDEMGSEAVGFGPMSFAKGTRPHLPKIDVRDLTPDDITKAFDNVKGWNDDLSLQVYGALRRGAAYGAEVKLLPPMDTMRALGRQLRLNGLPGFSDVMRTYRVQDPNKLTWGGAVIGGAAGGAYGDEGLEDMLRGAVGGAVVGRLGKAAAGKYGYLPDRLVKANTALRYSFSLVFDAGRISEQNLLAGLKHNLKPMWAPKKAMAAGTWKSPYTGTVHGDDVWPQVTAFWDEVNSSGGFFRSIEDSDRRNVAKGLLGFTPYDWEAAQAFQLYGKGYSMAKIRKSVLEIGRYGLGRTAIEKSANFIFFPFSFSKKLLTSLGDFMLQAPARALLLHEGLRQYHASSLDEGFHELIEKHAPLLQQLSNINNLYYGLSPGRFFLEGITDKRTNVAKVMEGLAAAFVPSGATTSLAQAAGSAGDWAMNAFTPIVVTGESLDRAGGIDGLEDIISRYIPLIREVRQYGEAIAEQVVAVSQGASPNYQYQAYVDGRRQAKADLEPLAMGMGYSSTDGLLQSDIGAAFQPGLEEQYRQLEKDNPTGFEMANKFENETALDKRALAELAEKPDKTAAEERILQVFEEIEKWGLISELAGFDSQLSHSLLSSQIRKMGQDASGSPRFVELWERFLAWQFGPLRRIA